MNNKSLNKLFRIKAQSMVEFALVLIIFLPILFGIMEVSRLIFIYSTVVSASREAARYGSAVGLNESGTIERYGDCAGIRAAANRVDFLDVITDDNILISYDHGPGLGVIAASCESLSGATIVPGDRINVMVSAVFSPVVKIMFAELMDGIPISSRSSRSIMGKIDLNP